MHIGKNNRQHQYTLPTDEDHRISLSITNEERDLGIKMTPDFKFSSQASHAASKASSILAILRRTFVSRDVEIWATLYRVYVRPHLEFAISAWNPFLRRDICVLEKVQRRATRVPSSLRGHDYNDRMIRMNITSLELRSVAI